MKDPSLETHPLKHQPFQTTLLLRIINYMERKVFVGYRKMEYDLYMIFIKNQMEEILEISHRF